MTVATQILNHCPNTHIPKSPISVCACNEKVLFRENDEVILKCRVVKIANGKAWAKCKRCGQWVLIPLRMVQ